MKKVIFVIAGLVLSLPIQIYAYDDGDFQVWNTGIEEFRINNDSKIALEQEFRWQDNASEFYYHHYDAGFFCNVKKHLNIGCGYRYIYEFKKRKFKIENAPYVTTTFLWESKGIRFDDRSRMEYRHFDYQADSWRYRNKITARLPRRFSKIGTQPYLSDEAFVGFGGTNQFNQNRFSSGLSMNITKSVKAEIYYMLQSTKSAGNWKNADILGTKLRIAF